MPAKKGIFDKPAEHCSDPHAKVSYILPSMYKICANNQKICSKVQFHQDTGSCCYAVHNLQILVSLDVCLVHQNNANDVPSMMSI